MKNPNNPPITQDLVDSIVTARGTNLSNSDICKKLKISHGLLCHIVNTYKHIIPRRRSTHRLTKKEIDSIVKLRKSGYRLSDIQEELSLNDKAVLGVIKREHLYEENLSTEARLEIHRRRQAASLKTQIIHPELKENAKNRWKTRSKKRNDEIRVALSDGQKKRVRSEEELEKYRRIRRDKNIKVRDLWLKNHGFNSMDERYEAIAINNGGHFLGPYLGSQVKNKWVCSKNHEFMMRPYCVLCGQWCPKCAGVGASKGENEVFEYVKSLGIECRQGEKQVLKVQKGKKKQELDVWIPSCKLAIEYNGLLWHCQKHPRPGSHKRKKQLCVDQNIRLLVIWEDEWESEPERIKDIIKHCISGDNPPRTYEFWTNGDKRVDPETYQKVNRPMYKVESYELD